MRDHETDPGELETETETERDVHDTVGPPWPIAWPRMAREGDEAMTVKTRIQAGVLLWND